MNANERILLEDCKGSWAREAHAQALEVVKAEGLSGEEAEKRFQEVKNAHYAELERIGLENIE